VTRRFVKQVPREQSARLDAEVDGLAALRATGTIRVPAVLDRGEDGPRAWLALEWLDLRPQDCDAALGRALAALHRAPAPTGVDPASRFGWHRDNFIGATPQVNAWHAEWAAFFRDCRLAPQLALAARNGYAGHLQHAGTRLLDGVQALLQGREPEPSLLHGDLWRGNAGTLPDGTPVLFDPAVYVGDRECDLAMTALFGGFGRDFLAAYREAWPVVEGYPVRCELYNLYHLLNHLNLFGGGYLAACERAIAALLAHVR
jgi:fructosamine-3-kinase